MPQPHEFGSTIVGNGDVPAETDRARDVPAPAVEVVDVEASTARHAPPGRAQSVVWVFRAGQGPRQVALDELPAVVADDANVAWVDLSDYVEQDLQELAGLLRLHEIGVRAALASWQRPRLDVFGDQFFVTATVASLAPDERRVRAQQLDLFVGRNFLLSAHKSALPFAERILARARQNPEVVRLDSAFMLYIILDQLVEHYEDLSTHIEDEIEQMEERALVDTSDAFLSDLLHFKRYVFALTRLAEQHHNVFVAFLRADFPFVADEQVAPYYRDLETRLDRLLGMLLQAKEAVNGAFDIYVSHISHRTNQIMKLLTLVSTILLPATVILGFFGTSFEGLPLYEPSNFWLMVAIITVVSAVILGLFRKRGWL